MVKSYLLCQIGSTPAPVLTLSIANATLSWDWAGSDPDHWEVEYSGDGVSGWTPIRSVAGALRSDPIADGDVFVRIVGQDASNNNITPYSNVVFSA